MKKSMGLFIVTILSMALGFIRESIVAYKLGASWEADVFIFAISLPTIIFSAIGGVLYTTILPLYTEARVKHGKDAANSFVGYVIKVVIGISFLFVLIGVIFPNVVVKIFAPGIGKISPIDLSTIVRIVVPSLLFLGIAYVFNGILNSFGDVIITSSIEIPMHLTIIFGLLIIYDIFGLTITIVSVLIGSALKLIFTYVNVKKWGYSYRGSSDIGKKYFNKMMHLILPMFISCMYMSIIQMISMNIASGLGEGNITIYNLANKLNNVCYSTAGNLIVIIIFPILAEYVAKNDHKNLSKVISKSFNLSLLIMLPISILLFTFSHQAVEILFGYGRFNAEEIERTSNVVRYLSIGLVFLGLKDILNRIFYSFKDRKISVINTFVSVGVFIVISIMLVPIFKIRALAIAMIVSLMISVLLLFKSLKRVKVSIDFKYMKKNIMSIIISSIFLIMLLKILKAIFIKEVINSKVILFTKVAGISTVSVLLYILFLYILKNDQIILLIDKLKELTIKKGKK